MTPTLTIDLRERDTLHGLLSRRLLILVENPSELAEVEGITVAELYECLVDDLRLLEDIGWASEADQEAVGLTMPHEKLAETLKRLRSDARRAPLSLRHGREPKESVDERWRRFRQAVEVCEELLCRLDTSDQDEEDQEPISGVSPEDAARHELTVCIPVKDGFVLAALERAELHEQETEVLTAALMGHLGFEWTPSTNRLFVPRLEELRRAGLLTGIERRGEPHWSLTSVGREQLAREREAGEIGELPESPQHRAWRHAREEAAVRIDGFRHEQTKALGAADELLTRYQPSLSQEWLDLSERLHWSTWHMASAIHCLHEWVEPNDEVPDVDESPGPGPGRRNVAVWDTQPGKSKEAAHE